MAKKASGVLGCVQGTTVVQASDEVSKLHLKLNSFCAGHVTGPHRYAEQEHRAVPARACPGNRAAQAHI